MKRISFLALKCWLIICYSKKVIKDNFLNLLYALYCVIFCADCCAIVLLHVNFDVAFCLISNFKHRVHELVTRFFGCTIMKKVEKHFTNVWNDKPGNSFTIATLKHTKTETEALIASNILS